MRVEFGGLTDIETGGVLGLEDELVCSFKLVADVVWGGVWQFLYGTERPAFLERDLVGLHVNGNCRSGFDTMVVNWCPFI